MNDDAIKNEIMNMVFDPGSEYYSLVHFYPDDQEERVGRCVFNSPIAERVAEKLSASGNHHGLVITAISLYRMEWVVKPGWFQGADGEWLYSTGAL